MGREKREGLKGKGGEGLMGEGKGLTGRGRGKVVNWVRVEGKVNRGRGMVNWLKGKDKGNG